MICFYFDFLIYFLKTVDVCFWGDASIIIFNISLLVVVLFFGFQFFTTKPLPCDPSSLPKYPPSKEFDAKVRDEEARRYLLFYG